MKVKIERITDWNDVYREALATVGKEPKRKRQPNNDWKKYILLGEHSPIRALEFRIEFQDIKYRTAMHLRTHHIGIWQPEDLVFISTQRDDRKADTISRDNKPQSAPVKAVFRMNAQSIINVSRKRLCSLADKDTLNCWSKAIVELEKLEPVLSSVCAKECIYRGFCPEKNTCGYTNSTAFINNMLNYRGVVRENTKK